MSPKPSIRDEQRALTRARLLDAARRVFARRGFHAASLEEIAQEAGATTGAIYSNFAGKEDLFLALFEDHVASQIGKYSKGLERPGNDFVERLGIVRKPNRRSRAGCRLLSGFFREDRCAVPVLRENYAAGQTRHACADYCDRFRHDRTL